MPLSCRSANFNFESGFESSATRAFSFHRLSRKVGALKIHGRKPCMASIFTLITGHLTVASARSTRTSSLMQENYVLYTFFSSRHSHSIRACECERERLVTRDRKHVAPTGFHPRLRRGPPGCAPHLRQPRPGAADPVCGRTHGGQCTSSSRLIAPRASRRSFSQFSLVSLSPPSSSCGNCRRVWGYWMLNRRRRPMCASSVFSPSRRSSRGLKVFRLGCGIGKEKKKNTKSAGGCASGTCARRVSGKQRNRAARVTCPGDDDVNSLCRRWSGEAGKGSGVTHRFSSEDDPFPQPPPTSPLVSHLYSTLLSISLPSTHAHTHTHTRTQNSTETPRTTTTSWPGSFRPRTCRSCTRSCSATPPTTSGAP